MCVCVCVRACVDILEYVCVYVCVWTCVQQKSYIHFLDRFPFKMECVLTPTYRSQAYENWFEFRIFLYPYLPTPPLGQDMTQGQFLSGV